MCFYCTTGTTRAGRQRDPDAVHAGLRESHRILLSRPLPNGDSWSFQPARGWYLKSVEPRAGEPLEWSVGSDNFATTHTNALPGMAEKIPDYENRHLHEFCQVWGYIVFPNGLEQTRATEVRPRRWTLNQAEGCDRRISDRFDLTLEAIRLFVDGKTSRDVSPLGDLLDAYGWFFEPFGAGNEGFRAYVDYFLLRPMVSGGRVQPMYGNELDFADALPGGSQSGYDRYIEAQGAAVRARTEAITQWWTSNPASDAAS